MGGVSGTYGKEATSIPASGVEIWTKRLLGMPRSIWKDNIKMYMQADGMDQIGLIWLRTGTSSEISSTGSWSLVFHKKWWIPGVAKKPRFLLQGGA